MSSAYQRWRILTSLLSREGSFSQISSNFKQFAYSLAELPASRPRLPTSAPRQTGLGRGFSSSTDPASTSGNTPNQPLSKPAPSSTPSPASQAARTEGAASIASEQASAAAATTTGGVTAEQQQIAAEKASSMMFPWERYQMDNANKPLRTWEKVYWWGFATILAYFMFTWGTEKMNQRPDENQKERERLARLEYASVILGRSPPPPIANPIGAQISFLGRGDPEEEDPFDGMSPAEIHEFILKEVQGLEAEEAKRRVAGEGAEDSVGNSSWRNILPSLPMHDQWEGKTPEEIERLVAAAK